MSGQKTEKQDVSMIGRKVRLWPGTYNGFFNVIGGQPLDATITSVKDAKLIGVLAVDHAGQKHTVDDVLLRGDGDAVMGGKHAASIPNQAAGFTLTREQVIEGAAKTAHEVNRAYCNSIGDRTQVRWENAEEWQRESARAGVIAVSNGQGPRELHESWCRQKSADGWRWGVVKDSFSKTHPCMIPYDQLPEAQQAKDHLFYAVVTNYLNSITGAKSLG